MTTKRKVNHELQLFPSYASFMTVFPSLNKLYKMSIFIVLKSYSHTFPDLIRI